MVVVRKEHTMAEAKAVKTDLKTIPTDGAGLPATLVHQSFGLGERAAVSYFGLLRDTRAELAQRWLATLDWLESLQHGVFKIAREASGRIDRLVGDSVDAGESMTIAMLGSGRGTALGATEIAAQTASSIVGEKAEPATKAA
jgi:hypothetical protein